MQIAVKVQINAFIQNTYALQIVFTLYLLVLAISTDFSLIISDKFGIFIEVCRIHYVIF